MPRLLAGSSVLALSIAAAAHGQQLTVQPLSGGFIQQRANAGAALRAQAVRPAPTNTAAGGHGLDNVIRAAAALRAQQAGQNAARIAALAAPAVIPNGLVPGGLVLADPAATLPDGSAVQSYLTQTDFAGSPTVLFNVAAPVQTKSATGQTIVTINQPGTSVAKGIITWSSFNIGRDTLVNFVQPTSDSEVLNRVLDPAASVIAGQLHANGHVYVLNRNGILFTGTAQVNVHQLTATTLDFVIANTAPTYPFKIDDTYFLTGFPFNTTVGKEKPVLVQPSDGPVTAAVTVAAGAQIATTGDYGRVMLAAPVIEQDGAIATPHGQTILAGATSLTLQPGHPFYNTLTAANLYTIDPSFTGLWAIANGAAGSPGAVNNKGTIDVGVGNAMLVAFASIQQNGVITGLTNAVEAGSVIVNAGTSVSFGPSSVTAIKPDIAFTIVSDANNAPQIEYPMVRDAFGRLALSDTAGNALAGTRDDQYTDPLQLSYARHYFQSEIDVASPAISLAGRDASGNPGALILAQGGNVTLAGQLPVAGVPPVGLPLAGSNGSFLVAPLNPATSLVVNPGAAIDVSGLRDIPLDQANFFKSFKAFATELSKAPLQREQFRNEVFTVDTRTNPAFLNITNQVGAVVHTVGERASQAGSVNLLSTGVALAAGGSINLEGGSVAYRAGFVPRTTRLIRGAHLFDIASADPTLQYDGICCTFTVTHARWKDAKGNSLAENYGMSLFAGSVYQPDYAVGASAGRAFIGTAATASPIVQTSRPILDADIYGGVVVGLRQRGRADDSSPAPNPGAVSLNLLTGDTTPFAFARVAPDADNAANWRSTPRTQITLPVAWTNSDGIGSLTVSATAPIILPQGISLNLPAAITNTTFDGTKHNVGGGGVLSLTTQGAVTINGAISAPGGSITLTTAPVFGTAAGNIAIGANAALSVAGNVVNDNFASDRFAAILPNGGSIKLTSGADLEIASGATLDATAGLYLPPFAFSLPSAVLNKPGGGFVKGSGAIAGSGGSIAIAASNSTDGKTSLEIGAVTLKAYGFGTGGSLSLTSGGPVMLTGDAATSLSNFRSAPQPYVAANAAQLGSSGTAALDGLIVPNGFLSQGGFSSITVRGLSLGVAPNATIMPKAQTLLAIPGGSGTAIEDYATPGYAPYLAQPGAAATVVQRPAAGLTLISTNGDLTVSAGSTIRLEAGGALTLKAVEAGYSLKPASGPVDYFNSIDNALTFLNNPVQTLGIYGTLDAPAGSITLTFALGAGRAKEGTNQDVDRVLYIAPTAHILATGIEVPLADPFGRAAATALPAGVYPDSCCIADGGSVALTHADFIYASPGSVIDVSGTNGVLSERVNLLANASGTLTGYQASNGGSIAFLSAFATYIDGTLRAFAGDSSSLAGGNTSGSIAQGGRLTLTQFGATVWDLRTQDPKFGPSPGTIWLTPSDPSPWIGTRSGNPTPTLPGFAYLNQATIDAAGFDSVSLNASTIKLNGSAAFGKVRDLAITTDQLTTDNQTSVALVADHATFNSWQFASNSAEGGQQVSPVLTAILGTPQTKTDAAFVIDTGSLDLNSLYVNFGYSGASSAISNPALPHNISVPSEGTVLFIADSAVDTNPVSTIPSYFGIGSFNGPITLRGRAAVRLNGEYTGDTRAPSAAGARFSTSGALTIDTADLYSTYGVGQLTSQVSINVINSFGPSAAVPLVAGTGITLQAPVIDISGTIRAPLGQITLQGGFNAYNGQPTAGNFTLEPGALLSTSLDGQTIPFGQTSNFQAYWFEPGPNSAFTSLPPDSPPQASVTFVGAKIVAKPGSTIDLSGGGDLYGYEFQPGIGGPSDVLAQTSNSTPIYAILPYANQQALLASPIMAGVHLPQNDPTMGPLDSAPAFGQTITLTGNGTVPSGTYVLLPAHYALLPGGYRINLASSGSNTSTVANAFVLPPFVNALKGLNVPIATGGTLQAGYLGSVLRPGQRADGSIQNLGFYQIDPGSVVRKQSKYLESFANSRIYVDAKTNQTFRPILPRDSGALNLALSTGGGFNFAGHVDFAHGSGGLGGLVDIYLTDTPTAKVDGYNIGLFSYYYSLPAPVVNSEIDIVSASMPTGADADPALQHVYIPVESLNQFGDGSIVIGAKITKAFDPLKPAPYTIQATPTVQNIVVDLRGQSLNARELTLSASNTITIASGSSIVASTLDNAPPVGLVELGSGSLVRVDANGRSLYNYMEIGVQGAFLRVSGGPVYDVTRFNLDNETPAQAAVDPFYFPFVAGAPFCYTNCSLPPNLQTFGPGIGFNPNAGQLILSQGSVLSAGGSITGEAYNETDLQIGASLTAPALFLKGAVVNVGISGAGNIEINSGTFRGLSASRLLRLQALSQIDFFSNFDATVTHGLGDSASQLVLDSPVLVAKNDNLALNFTADTVELLNTFGSLPTTPPTSGAGANLTILASGTPVSPRTVLDPLTPYDANNHRVDHAGQIIISGSRDVLGFSTLNLAADDTVLFTGLGSGVSLVGALVVKTPLLTGYAGANAVLQSNTAVSLLPYSGGIYRRAEPSSSFGASLSLIGPTVVVDSHIAVPGGNLSIEATTGDVTLTSNAELLANASPRAFFDQLRYAPGGIVALKADAGNVVARDGAVVDVGSYAGGLIAYGLTGRQVYAPAGGDAGTLNVTAGSGQFLFSPATLPRGAPAGGVSGTFALDTVSLASLDALDGALTAAGFNQARTIHVAQGDLVVGLTPLIAHSVTLTADAGSVTVNGLIDASGTSPGTVRLNAANSINITGTIDAHANAIRVDSYGLPIDADNRPLVVLNAENGALNPGSRINLIGGTINLTVAGTTQQGEVDLRAPQLFDALGNPTDAGIALGAKPTTVLGARHIQAEGYKIFDLSGISTIDQAAGTIQIALPVTNPGPGNNLLPWSLDPAAPNRLTTSPNTVITATYSCGIAAREICTPTYPIDIGNDPVTGLEVFIATVDSYVRTITQINWKLTTITNVDRVNVIRNDAANPFYAAAGKFGAIAPALSQRLQPIVGAGSSAVEVSSGVEIRSTGDLALNSPWDLSQWRFGPSAIPINLTVAAKGNLVLNAPISDGVQGVSILPNASPNNGGSQAACYGAAGITGGPCGNLSDDRSGSIALVAGANLASANRRAVLANIPDPTSGNLIVAGSRPGANNSAFSNGAVFSGTASSTLAKFVFTEGNDTRLLNNSPSGGGPYSYDCSVPGNCVIAQDAYGPGTTGPYLRVVKGAQGHSVAKADYITPVNTQYNTSGTYAGAAYVRTGTGTIDLVSGKDIALGWVASNDPTGGNEQAVWSGAGKPYAAGAIYNSGQYDALATVYTVGRDRETGLVQTPRSTTPYVAYTPPTIHLVNSGGSITLDSRGDINAGPSPQLINDWLWRKANADGSAGYGIVVGATNLPTLLDDLPIYSGQSYYYPRRLGTDYLFAEGVGALGGGIVAINAGGSARNVSAESVSTVNFAGGATDVAGGGDVIISAGGAILGGNAYSANGQNTSGVVIQTDYQYLTPSIYAGRGSATLTARGIAAAADSNCPKGGCAISNIGLGDAQATIVSAGSVLLTPFDPFGLPPVAADMPPTAKFPLFFGYNQHTRLIARSLAGDVNLDAGITVFSGAQNSVFKKIGTLGTFNTPIYQRLFGLNAFNPNYGLHHDASSAFNTYGTLANWSDIGSGSLGGGQSGTGGYVITPPTIEADAFTGNIKSNNQLELFPAPLGNFALLAYSGLPTSTINRDLPQLIDVNPSVLPSARIVFSSGTGSANSNGSAIQSPLIGWYKYINYYTAFFIQGANIPYHVSSLGTQNAQDQQYHAGFGPGQHLHDNDYQPARYYSVTGDITVNQPLQSKSVWIRAGGNLNIDSFVAPIGAIGTFTEYPYNWETGTFQNLHPGDVTMFEALGTLDVKTQLGGPGSVVMRAGHDITSDTVIETVGNQYDTNLPTTGANISALAGVNSGTGDVFDPTGFLAAYVDPANAKSQLTDYSGVLDAWLNTNYRGQAYYNTLFAGKTDWQAFASLDPEQQALFADQIFYAELKATARDENDPSSPRFKTYTRGYNAIAKLFPGSTYKGNLNLNGESYQLIPDLSTGKLAKKIAIDGHIETFNGGDIYTFAPGGGMILAQEGQNPQNLAGLLTGRGGEIGAYAATTIAVNQSRIFTLNGGDVTVWSNAGDIDAGKTGKSVAVSSPTNYRFNAVDNEVSIDPLSQSTGGGIGTRQGTDQLFPSSVYLIAPVGTVNASDAGISSTGDVVIAALHVLNGDNIDAAGKIIGVPPIPHLSAALLESASATNAATAIKSLLPRTKPQKQRVPAIITVEVVGFGEYDPTTDGAQKPSSKKTGSVKQAAYDPNANVRILGYGTLPDADQSGLTKQERSITRP